jgi:hypothetical protein
MHPMAFVTGAMLYVLLHTHTTVTCLLNTLGSPLTSEGSMKKIVALMLLAVPLASMLGGCIIVPDGGYHHHHDYYERY